jgi:predicted ferric reductase
VARRRGTHDLARGATIHVARDNSGGGCAGGGSCYCVTFAGSSSGPEQQHRGEPDPARPLRPRRPAMNHPPPTPLPPRVRSHAPGQSRLLDWPEGPTPAPAPPSLDGRRREWRLNPDDLFLAIFLGAVMIAAWPAVVALSGPEPLKLPVMLAHVCGMLAGYGVLVLIALMSRAPVLERGIGADVLARWHGRGGRLVIGLILVHAWAAVVAWAQSRGESTPLALWHVLRMPGLMTATVGTVVLLAVAAGSVRAARKRLSYEKWHGLHLLTYVGIALSFLHQLAGPDLVGHRLLQIAWALLYTQVFALLFRYRVLAPLRQAVRHRLRVAAVVREGPGVVSIVVEGQRVEELQAKPGQFFRWRFLTPDNWLTAHPFSLSAPTTDNRLRLTVKALGQGSAYLQEVAVGTWVVAEGPYGAMTAARRTRRDVLLIAGGVGITPMRALFETLPLMPGQDLMLLYRARGPEHVLFRQELDQIARDRGARIRYLDGGEHESLSPSALLGLVPDLSRRDVYLCGPPRMADGARRALHDAGLPGENLHEERFAF